jgi:hypothetical protein
MKFKITPGLGRAMVVGGLGVLAGCGKPPPASFQSSEPSAIDISQRAAEVERGRSESAGHSVPMGVQDAIPQGNAISTNVVLTNLDTSLKGTWSVTYQQKAK